EWVSIDVLAAEQRYAREFTDALTPEQVYTRRWALTVLQRVMDRLEREHAAPGKCRRFSKLKRFLDDDELSYEMVAAEEGEAVGTLRVQVYRLRQQYQDLLRDEIAKTVCTPAD